MVVLFRTKRVSTIFGHPLALFEVVLGKAGGMQLGQMPWTLNRDLIRI